MKHVVLGLLAGTVLPFALKAQEPSTPSPAWVGKFQWRSIGPANMGGRITDISIYEKDPKIWFAATASGGLLKTVNNGITFEHQFDKETTVSIGAVCVAPSDKNIVWVGTGEENPRNSVSYGDGVYKSVDGGKTWKNMGLPKTFQIGAIVVHPKNPDVVYVGALGRLYGHNEERGLYKTSNGGKSWKKIHYVDEKTGVIAIEMHPTDPNTLIFATYERQRDGFDVNSPAKKIAPGSGIYRTKDGGKTFQKLTRGLPSNDFGRVGLDYYRKDPNVVFALVECAKMGQPGDYVGYSGIVAGKTKKGVTVAQAVKDSPAAKAGMKPGDVITALNGKKVDDPEKLIHAICQFEVDEKVKVTFQRGEERFDESLELVAWPKAAPQTRGGFGRRRGGASPGPYGRTYGGTLRFSGRLGGQAANMQAYQGKHGYENGGVFRSDDGGTSWKRVNSFDPRPMYFSQIRVDPQNDKNLFILGISGSKSVDGGVTFTSGPFRGVHADHHALWIDPRDPEHMILGCDGGIYVSYDRSTTWAHLNHAALGQFYHVAIGPRRDYWVYGGLQDNGTWGAPHRAAGGPVNEDWLRIGGGDGFLVCVDPNDPDQLYFESQNGATRRTNLRTGESGFIRAGSSGRGGGTRSNQRGGGQGNERGAQRGAQRGASSPRRRRYRYNWRTPFMLSHHNSRIYYNVGNHVFRSLDRGNDLKAISPDITLSSRGSGTAIAESPRNPDVLYAGTDDGALWMTRKGDHEWVDLRKAGEAGEAGEDTGNGNDERPAGVPFTEIVKKPMWISGIEASRFHEGRVYVSVDGHRSDDDDPYVLVSEDYGRSWTSLRSNLPRGSTRCIREDRVNENLLYCGTEFGLYISLDRGKKWIRFHNNLPTVAVHEVAQHATCNDIVVATHGRSLWSIDIGAVRQMTAKAMQEPVAVFQPSEVIQWRRGASRGSSGGVSRFVGQTPSSAPQIYFHLKQKPAKLAVQIKDQTGKVIRDIKVEAAAGLNHVTWDGRSNPTPRGSGGTGRGATRGRGRSRFTRGAPTGSYTVVVTADGVTKEASFQISEDPRPR